MSNNAKRIEKEVNAEAAKQEVIETKVDEPKKRRRRSYDREAPLALPSVPGFQCRWILVDSRARPGRFMSLVTNGDYTPVKPAEIGLVDDSGKPLQGDTIFQDNNGDGKLLYVKTPIEFFDEDQKAKTQRSMARLQPKDIGGEITGSGIKITSNITFSH